MTRRLVATYRPERIFLFGSRARGTAGPDSDYDLLVVVPDDVPLPCSEARGPTRLSGDSRRPVTSSSGPTPPSPRACTSGRPCRPRSRARGDCSIPADQTSRGRTGARISPATPASAACDGKT
ncbi:MAG TPA: hypothetical protein DCQ64_27910 [Candidatus Rokubacteria bacterium]|nr:hypothetical protein [Candidatus Rokubacteria bacterium]